MNDIENSKTTMESEELYNKEDELLEALKNNEIAFLKYKKATEQEREKMNEQIARTLGISPEEMRDKYANELYKAIEKTISLKEKLMEEYDKHWEVQLELYSKD